MNALTESVTDVVFKAQVDVLSMLCQVALVVGGTTGRYYANHPGVYVEFSVRAYEERGIFISFDGGLEIDLEKAVRRLNRDVADNRFLALVQAIHQAMVDSLALSKNRAEAVDMAYRLLAEFEQKGSRVLAALSE